MTTIKGRTTPPCTSGLRQENSIAMQARSPGRSHTSRTTYISRPTYSDNRTTLLEFLEASRITGTKRVGLSDDGTRVDQLHGIDPQVAKANIHSKPETLSDVFNISPGHKLPSLDMESAVFNTKDAGDLDDSLDRDENNNERSIVVASVPSPRHRTISIGFTTSQHTDGSSRTEIQPP